MADDFEKYADDFEKFDQDMEKFNELEKKNESLEDSDPKFLENIKKGVSILQEAHANTLKIIEAEKFLES